MNIAERYKTLVIVRKFFGLLRILSILVFLYVLFTNNLSFMIATLFSYIICSNIEDYAISDIDKILGVN